MQPLAAARRHPGRSVLAVGALLAVTVPVAFYLVSPLFIRTTLVEAAPVAVVASVAPQATELPVPRQTTVAAATSTPFSPAAVSSGQFAGTDAVHFGSGTATIVETAPGVHVLRLEDFSVLNGPDLFVYLSPNASGYTDKALELGRLKATDGSFNYDLPAGTDPTDFASAIIWCKQFSHLFAVAPLSAG